MPSVDITDSIRHVESKTYSKLDTGVLATPVSVCVIPECNARQGESTLPGELIAESNNYLISVRLMIISFFKML